jgi:HD-like signal output (HDOD) protein
LSRAAVELAALVVSGEYNAVAVGEILEGDEELKEQVLNLANSALYAASDPVESASVAAQRIGMRGLWELAVIKVARSQIFGPVLESVLGGEQTWNSARIAGAISHRVSSTKLGANRASMLAGLILCAGTPLGHQMIQRVEKRQGAELSSRMRRELVSRVGPALCLMLARNWSLPPAIEAAAAALADGRNELPANREVQVAVFSTYLGRLLAAQGFDNLSIPLVWPSTLALEIDERELGDIVSLATTSGSAAIGF